MCSSQNQALLIFQAQISVAILVWMFSFQLLDVMKWQTLFLNIYASLFQLLNIINVVGVGWLVCLFVLFFFLTQLPTRWLMVHVEPERD